MFRICILIVTGLLALHSTAAVAQTYPNKPIRMILPFPPGAPSDIVGRAMAQKLSEQLGVNVIADNRVGAGGNLGISLAAKSPPDGYTIMTTSPSIAISPVLYKNTGYDAQRDLVAIARFASIENVMVVHPSVPVKTLRQFIDLARKQPGKLNYGSGGAGTTNHLANELLKTLENLNIVHVPYKGATVATVALMGGEVDQVVVSVASILSQIRAGKLRAIVVLSEKRVPTLPEVPTSTEAGVPAFRMSIWFGLLGPARLPPEIIAKLNQESLKALASPDLLQRFAGAGVDPWPGTPEQMDQLIRSETARYAKIAEKAGLKKE
ncbi:MAG: tripartite tricarboxylate transporter substrate binding protein [Burkholderiales bacterium]